MPVRPECIEQPRSNAVIRFVRTAASAASILLALAAHGAAPTMNDYAQGVVVEAHSTLPMIELALPDPVYLSLTRSDLRDLRVFNANGEAVAHAFCAAPETAEPQISEHSLPIFELKDAQRSDRTGARIEVQTPDGTQVNVRDLQSLAAFTGGGHIIDARAIEAPLRAITFDWSSPDQASEIRVQIEASKDLDRWERIVAATTLLRAGEDGQLRRERVELPLRTYAYLRVQRVDGGPPPVLNGVVAEAASPAAELEPLWFMPNATASEEAHALMFETGRTAPVRFARIRQTMENSAMNVTLQSRADDDSPWRERFTGESYLIVNEGDRRESPLVRFEATTDRYWRLLMPKDAASVPILELGYRPSQLLFLAQGPGPYTIAFGSRRAELANPSPCDGLLGDVSAQDRRNLIAEGYVGELKVLGGEGALKPAPRETPARVVVLWAVLIVGVGLLIAMAVSLLKRVRTIEPGA